MTLPKGFLFSQSSLQDYVECQRRFQLRHLLHQAWPAVEAEPFLENEHRIDQGARFHQIVRQFLAGIPEEQVSKSIAGDEEMEKWWLSFLQSMASGFLKPLYESVLQHYEEITLSIPINNYRIVAKFDALLVQPEGRWNILDWKTSQNHPKRQWLKDRLQTHVYPFVLVGAAPHLAGQLVLDPDLVEMIYWFTNQPGQPERFTYSSSGYHQDEIDLTNLVSKITKQTDLIFPLTPDVKRCLFCNYRSLCNRGENPGDLQHLEDWVDAEATDQVTIDFDQIGEIEL